MADIDPTCPMDRVLTDETRARIMRTYRGLLSAPNSPIEETELAENLPLGIDVLLLSRLDDTVMHAEILIDQDEHPTLIADEVVDCPHHAEGDELSALGELGDEYADLEADLIEVAALMCDLPEYEDELEQNVTDRVAFQLTTCYEGLLTFEFRVADLIVQAYQDYEYECYIAHRKKLTRAENIHRPSSRGALHLLCIFEQ